jgi:hypothetical protein
MRRILSIALLSLLLAVPAFADEAASKGPSTYGAPVTETKAVPIAKLAKKPRTYTGRTIRIEGTVKDVCQGQGCWLEVQDAKGATFIAKSLDESVLVPKDCKGQRVVVQGVLTARTAKGHDHSHEAGETPHECPAPTYVLDTRGVELTPKQ